MLKYKGNLSEFPLFINLGLARQFSAKLSNCYDPYYHFSRRQGRADGLGIAKSFSPVTGATND